MKLDRDITIDDLPIPTDVRETTRWTEQMREMAAHIGPYRTLLVIDSLGGQVIDIPSDPAANRLASVIGDEGAAIMSRIYGGNRLTVPVGRAALNEARRAGVVAAVRAKQITASEGAMIARTSRSYFSFLVNSTVEGQEAEPYIPRRSRHDPRQIEMFPQPLAEDTASPPVAASGHQS
jgi:hypothetical protein